MDDFEKLMESMSLDAGSLHNQLLSFASAVNMTISVLFGFVIFAVYYYSTGKTKRDLNMCQVIPALSLLMTVLMRMQGGRAAIFFGIFGVLSIVRFRSELTDQKGITFILFGLINGLLVGVGNYILAALGIFVLFCIYFGLKNRVLSKNSVVAQIKASDLQESSKLLENFFHENGIKYNFLTPQLKFDVNKNNILEDFSKLKFQIYFKSDKDLIVIFDKMKVLIKANNMQIEVSDKC